MGHVFGVVCGLPFARGGRWVFFHPAKTAEKFNGDPAVAGRFTKSYFRIVGAFFLLLGLCGACLTIVPESFGEKYGLGATILPLAAAVLITFLVLRRARSPKLAQNP